MSTRIFSISATAILLALVGAVVAITLSAAPLTTTHRIFEPRRAPNGMPLRTPRNQFVSTNWSGYVTPNYATGKTYTSASSTWIVPAVANTVEPGYSSSWVGIGGFCLNASCHRVDNSLIQLGTEQDVDSSGTAHYYAWYEMLPAAETQIPTSQFAVFPGDTIVASLALQPIATSIKNSKSGTHGGGSHGGSGSTSSNTWVLTLKDTTHIGQWSTTVSYKSSLASAEWVQEAPYSAGILPLANFGTATFDPGTVNGGQNPNLTTSESVVMSNTNGQTSNVSNPDSDTDGFNACWGSSDTFTACNAPQS